MILAFNMKSTIVLYILLLLLYIGASTSDLIASSKVERCVLDGTNPNSEDQALNCTKKMIVTMSLESGQGETEAIEAVVYSTLDENGDPQQLEYPFKIQFAKSRTSILYPVFYMRSVNGNPSESIIFKGINIFGGGCQAGEFEANPTCGWAVTANGDKISYSQGFCCSCSLAQVLGLSNDGTRASLNCELFGDQMTSAHCLRWGEYWYDMFGIREAQMDFIIQMRVTRRAMVDGFLQTTEELLQMSPSVRGVVSGDKEIMAKLVGDFQPYQEAPVLSEKYLAVPTQPVADARVTAGLSSWMFVDKYMVDLSGLSCNKIGVSYEAFYSDPNACAKKPMSCLKNQLNDLYNDDLILRDAGVATNYLISSYGNFLTTLDPENNRYLVLQNTAAPASLITLTLKADDIRYIVNRSPGEIISLMVKDFEALSRNGHVEVIAGNTGNIFSDYWVSITNCTEGIQAIPAQTASIPPFQAADFNFDLYAANELGSQNECDAVLYDSQHEVLDLIRFNFTTYATNKTRGNQGGIESPLDGTGLGDGTGSLDDCSKMCPSFFDLPCFVLKGCWGLLAAFIIVCVVVIVAIIVLIKTKCCKGPIKKCCRVCKSKEGTRDASGKKLGRLERLKKKLQMLKVKKETRQVREEIQREVEGQRAPVQPSRPEPVYSVNRSVEMNRIYPVISDMDLPPSHMPPPPPIVPRPLPFIPSPVPSPMSSPGASPTRPLIPPPVHAHSPPVPKRLFYPK